MPLSYQVDPQYQTRPRRTSRRMSTDKTPPVLPSAKPPEAVTVVPPAPRYSVIPQEVPPIQMEEPPPPDMPTSQLTRPRTITPPVATEAPLPDPYGVETARANYTSARNAPVEKTGRLKAFGEMAMYALGQTKPGKDWSDVVSQVGQGLGAGVSGAVRPELPGATQKLYNVQKAEDELATAQKIASSASLANYRTDTVDLRRDKMEMDQAYRAWQKQDKTRLTDNTINRTKFLQEYMRHKQVATDSQNAFMNSYRERGLQERMRQFNANDEIKRAQLVVNQARQKTYEESVKNGLTVAQAKLASEAAEGQALLDAADDYEDILAGLDPMEDYDQVLQVRRDQRRARREGAAKIAAAQAAGQVRGTNVAPDRFPGAQTMPMTTAPAVKPKRDPLGLFP